MACVPVSRRRLLAAFMAGALGAGCRADFQRNASGMDGGDVDAAGAVDARLVVPDAAVADADPPDADLPDAAMPDAAMPDASVPDAALPDAAPPDTAIPDAALPDAAPSCGPGVFFCDDFEGPLASTWPKRTNNVTTTQSVSHGGSSALLASLPTNNGNAWVGAPPFSVQTSGTLYARGWYRFPSGTALTHMDLLYLGRNDIGVSIFVLNGSFRAFSTAAGVRLDTGYNVPFDTWICLELIVQLSATQGVMQVVMNENTPYTRIGLDTLGQGMEDFSVGIPYSQSGQPAGTVVYVDDVAVGTQRIGCN